MGDSSQGVCRIKIASSVFNLRAQYTANNTSVDVTVSGHVRSFVVERKNIVAMILEKLSPIQRAFASQQVESLIPSDESCIGKVFALGPITFSVSDAGHAELSFRSIGIAEYGAWFGHLVIS